MRLLSANIKAIFPLLLVVFIDELGNGLFYPLLTPIVFDPTTGILGAHASLATRQWDYGLLLCVFPLMMFLSSPIIGDLSDHYGRKKVLLLSLFGTAIGYGLCAYGVMTKSLSILMLGRALDGITAGNFPIAQAAIIDLSPSSLKTKNISTMVFAISLGFIIGPVMAGLLSNQHYVSWFGLAVPLYGSALLALLNMALLVVNFKESFQPVTRTMQLSLLKATQLFTTAFKDKTLRGLSVVFLFLIFAWGAYIQFVTVFAFRVYHFSTQELAILMVVLACSFALASQVIIRLLLLYLSDLGVTKIALFISAIGVLVTVVTSHALWMWLGIVPISIGIALAHATVISLYSNAVSEDRQGWIMGITSSVLSVGILLSAAVVSVIGEFSLRMPLWVAFVAYVLSFILIFLVVSPKMFNLEPNQAE